MFVNVPSCVMSRSEDSLKRRRVDVAEEPTVPGIILAALMSLFEQNVRSFFLLIEMYV